jgi:hypothetical protein
MRADNQSLMRKSVGVVDIANRFTADVEPVVAASEIDSFEVCHVSLVRASATMT